MHELTEEDTATRDGFVARLKKASEQIKLKEDKANDVVAELNDAIQAYNDILKEADTFCTDKVNDMTTYFGTKSEGWKEENGEAYDDWISQWTNLDLEKVGAVDDVTVQDYEHADGLASLPARPE